MSKKAMLIGAIIFTVLAFWSLSSYGGSPINYLGFAWIAGIWAWIALYKKGYGAGIPILIWLLFGWEVMAFLLCFGYALLFIAAFVPTKRRCSHCKQFIHQEATRCPKCQGSVAPVTT